MVGYLRLVAGLLAMLPLAISQNQTNVISSNHPPCGATDPPESLLQAHQELAEQNASGQVDKRQYNGIQVPVYWHVVAVSQNYTDGYLTPQQVRQAIRVLNQDFLQHGISFNLVNSYIYYNATWANGQDGDEMRRRLRIGPYSALNIYSRRRAIYDFLGYCYFPTNLTTEPQFSYLDGCEINYGTTPNGNYPEYNQGKVLTHEVGHWFGLLHTFQGESCSGHGDYIADTPQQKSPPYECDDTIDTCPQQQGNDPWDNHMNYVPDACKNEFTPDQETRMKAMYRKYRGQGFGG